MLAGETPEQPPILPDLMSTLNVLDVPRQVCAALALLVLSMDLHFLQFEVTEGSVSPSPCAHCIVTASALGFCTALGICTAFLLFEVCSQ